MGGQLYMKNIFYAQDLNNNELQHYGILGMKWGIRRYQNYDGTYTKKGLERYEKAKSAYETSKNKTKGLKSSSNKVEYNKSKMETKSAKKSLKKAYKELKYDKLADQGRELYRSGKTITTNEINTKTYQTILYAGTLGSAYVLRNSGNQKVSTIGPMALMGGGSIISAILYGKQQSDSKKLRAYYSHTTYKG